jgi:hypothetical protein
MLQPRISQSVDSSQTISIQRPRRRARQSAVDNAANNTVTITAKKAFNLTKPRPASHQRPTAIRLA